MTTTAESANLPPDTSKFFQRGNYAPVPDEITEYDLTVEGTIPPELDGWYLRNGSNPRQPTGHWLPMRPCLWLELDPGQSLFHAPCHLFVQPWRGTWCSASPTLGGFWIYGGWELGRHSGWVPPEYIDHHDG